VPQAAHINFTYTPRHETDAQKTSQQKLLSNTESDFPSNKLNYEFVVKITSIKYNTHKITIYPRSKYHNHGIKPQPLQESHDPTWDRPQRLPIVQLHIPSPPNPSLT
jgi:hypothetical protein